MRIADVVIAVGVALVVVGLVLRFAPWLVAWFGRLPGDLRFERDGLTVFVPITSMVIVSILLSVVLTIVARR